MHGLDWSIYVLQSSRLCCCGCLLMVSVTPITMLAWSCVSAPFELSYTSRIGQLKWNFMPYRTYRCRVFMFEVCMYRDAVFINLASRHSFCILGDIISYILSTHLLVFIIINHWSLYQFIVGPSSPTMHHSAAESGPQNINPSILVRTHTYTKLLGTQGRGAEASL